jgi:putative transposase
LSRTLSRLHTTTAIELNKRDEAAGRRVWFQYWDSHVTFQPSYFARLKYVHQNPVHQGIVDNAESCRWCSASWFAGKAKRSFYRTVESFKIDRVNVPDDFEVLEPVAE